jgi:replicative DNA helicase
MIDPLLSKIPPNNLEMEEAVLSAILINNAGLDEIEDLTPDDFYSGANKRIFKTFLNLRKQKEPVDLMTVVTKLTKQNELDMIGGAAYLVKISDNAPVATNIKAYAKRIMELAKARELIIVASGIVQDGFNVDDIEQYISDSQSKILDIQTTVSKDKFTNMSELMEIALKNIQAAQTSEFKLGLNFGMPKLDNFMQIWGSKLILLAGRPGMGKSSLAFSIAVRQGFQDNPCGILSIEMDKEQFADKTLSVEADINSMIFYARKSLSREGYEKLNNAASLLSGLPIYIDDSECNIEDVKRKCRKLKKLGCKLIIIDQLNQIAYDKGLTPYVGISKNCSALKQFTKELRIPILLLCQLNRNLEIRSDKRPIKADLAETGRLEQDADIILFLYRAGYYDRKIDESITEIILSKNRQGETGVEHQVRFNKKRGMFQLN